MQIRRLPFRALCLWEFYAVVGLAALALLVYIFLVPFTWLWYLVVGIISVVFLACALLILPVLYLGTQYSVGHDTVVCESGVLFRYKSVLARSDIITVSLVQTPFDRLFGLASLRCNAPGAVVVLFYLSRRDARHLQSQLTGGPGYSLGGAER